MSKPLKHLRTNWKFPITFPKLTHPCGCCKSEIHPVNHAHLERYGTYYCDRVCFVQAMGAEYVGDGVDKVTLEGNVFLTNYFIKSMEVREYG